MANQWSANPSTTYGAYHIRMRKIRGKASQFCCYWCGDALAQEWCQLRGTDGSDPFRHYVPSCMKCHRAYDGTPAAVAVSNRNRKGEKRNGYTIRMDPKEYRELQRSKVLKRWGCDAV